MNERVEKAKKKAREAAAKRLDPSKLVAGTIAAIAAFVLQLLVIPPVVNPQVQSLQGYVVKGLAAGAVLLITVLLPQKKRSVARIFALAFTAVVLFSAAASAGYFYLSIKDAVSLHQRAAGWTEILNDTFRNRAFLQTKGTDTNGSGNASTGGGVLTLRLRSTHVANQQYLVTDVAPTGQEYYVETSFRRQSGPVGSACFLAFGVVDSDRYFLFDVTSDQRPGRPLHSAQIFQEVSADPAVEKPVDSSPALPYVDHWSLLWPPGADSEWTQLAIHRVGTEYEFFVDGRRVSQVTGLPVPNGRITVGVFDPGTADGSYAGCQFRYLRAWKN
jgi:hypothetical protein